MRILTLTSRMGLAFVTGLQGDDPKYLKVVATPKHFAVHSGPEQLRHEFDVNPSPQDLAGDLPSRFPHHHRRKATRPLPCALTTRSMERPRAPTICCSRRRCAASGV